jgi:hypothetical protein
LLKLHFNYKDVFRAARLGFSPKKMWVMFWGLLLGLAAYGFFGYLAHAAAGRALADTWAMFGLVPLPWTDFGFWAWLLWFAGVLVFAVTMMLASAMTARITAEQLAGNEFFEVKEAAKFLKDSWKSVLGAPLVIILFVVFLLACGAILGLWGRIPLIGHLTVSLLALPIYFVCLFVAFLLAALAVALWYVPVIVGATRSDTFDSLFETFSAITSQPWRLVVYTGLLKLVTLAGFLVFGWFTMAALGIAFQVLSVAMGQKFLDIALSGIALYTPPVALNAMIGMMNSCCGFGGMVPLAPCSDLGWAGHISAFITGMTFNVVRLIVLSYAASAFVVGQTMIYGIIVMKRDERDIFERREEKPAEVSEPEACETKEEPATKKATARAKGRKTAGKRK